MIEHSHLLDQWLGNLLHGVEDLLRREVVINDHRDVPRNRWKSRKWAKNNAPRTVLNDPHQVKFGHPGFAGEVP